MGKLAKQKGCEIVKGVLYRIISIYAAGLKGVQNFQDTEEKSVKKFSLRLLMAGFYWRIKEC
ncbi:MAG: hypothetical protein ACXVHW_12065 [Methanobacterium sp.]